MEKPKSRPRGQNVEQEGATDDEARLETFERGAVQNTDDDALSRIDTPDSLVLPNERLDLDD